MRTVHGFHDFERALWRGRRRAAWAWLQHARHHLPTLASALAGRPGALAHPAGSYEEIALEDVVGTVSEARARDFGADFMPLRLHDAARWLQVLEAVEWQGLPPVHVQRYEGKYYVEDGHHRASVMRSLNVASVEAYVADVRAVRDPMPDARGVSRSPIRCGMAPYRAAGR